MFHEKFTKEEMQRASALCDKLIDIAVGGTKTPSEAVLALAQSASILCKRHNITHAEILQRINNPPTN